MTVPLALTAADAGDDDVAGALQNYFSDPWNVFDFIIVLGSITDIIYTEVTVSVLSSTRALHNCVERNGRDAARRAAPSAVVETCSLLAGHRLFSSVFMTSERPRFRSSVAVASDATNHTLNKAIVDNRHCPRSRILMNPSKH